MSLIGKMKHLRRRFLYGDKADSETYLSHLKSVGIEIGDGCVIWSPELTHIEEANPHLITIGSHVDMTGPVTILCHDYSVGVTKRWNHGEVLGSQKRVTIGDNVFLGWGCTVLAGTTIGDNSVIGAHAVATGNLPGGFIYAGSPAKPVCSIEEYYEKRKKRQLDEALAVYAAYKERFGKVPPIEVFREYFYLFTTNPDTLCEALRRKLDDKGNPEECVEWLKRRGEDAPFGSYGEFCEYAEEHVR